MFFEFLLILLIVFVVWPLCKGAWAVYRMRRAYKETINSARRAAEQAQAASRPGGWSAPRSRKSKIVNPNEGEYVEWEDVAADETAEATSSKQSSASGQNSRYFRERITDAEWEDL